MFNYTDAEIRLAGFVERAERVNRESWMRQKPTLAERRRTRRQFGAALVRLGGWLQGNRAGQAANAPAAGYTLDAAR